MTDFDQMDKEMILSDRGFRSARNKFNTYMNFGAVRKSHANSPGKKSLLNSPGKESADQDLIAEDNPFKKWSEFFTFSQVFN